MRAEALGVTSGVTNAQISSCTRESKTTKRPIDGRNKRKLPKKSDLGAWEENLGGWWCTSFGTRGSQVQILPLRPTFSMHEPPLVPA
jgi:hypothetical protein